MERATSEVVPRPRDATHASEELTEALEPIARGLMKCSMNWRLAFQEGFGRQNSIEPTSINIGVRPRN